MIPDELEEGGRGCLPSGCFWRIPPPMARPALGTVSVRAVVGSRRNFLLPKARRCVLGSRHGACARLCAVAERRLTGCIAKGATKG
ncbi:hypothetical protein ACFT38_44590 [Streptomyces sp. NPDC056975]|uniref:hypothetical protein n=1 Tax=Streptomyces sp. NPDC056975 TaxID=3345985 RepID=UPI0036441482